MPWPAWLGIAVVAALLIYEHSLLHANDLSRLNAAFFNVNGYISILFLLFWGAAVWVEDSLNPGFRRKVIYEIGSWYVRRVREEFEKVDNEHEAMVFENRFIEPSRDI